MQNLWILPGHRAQKPLGQGRSQGDFCILRFLAPFKQQKEGFTVYLIIYTQMLGGTGENPQI